MPKLKPNLSSVLSAVLYANRHSTKFNAHVCIPCMHAHILYWKSISVWKVKCIIM